jgi:hypothetical protein
MLKQALDHDQLQQHVVAVRDKLDAPELQGAVADAAAASGVDGDLSRPSAPRSPMRQTTSRPLAGARRRRSLTCRVTESKACSRARPRRSCAPRLSQYMNSQYRSHRAPHVSVTRARAHGCRSQRPGASGALEWRSRPWPARCNRSPKPGGLQWLPTGLGQESVDVAPEPPFEHLSWFVPGDESFDPGLVPSLSVNADR